MNKYAIFNVDGTWLFDIFADTASIALRDARSYTAEAHRSELVVEHRKTIH